METNKNQNIPIENNTQPNPNEGNTQGQSIGNIFLFKENSSSSLANNSSKNEPLFNLNTNSLFAYQEIDQFSSFCDSDSNLAKKNNYIDASNETSIDTKIDEISGDVTNDNIINNRRRNTFNNILPTSFNNCNIFLNKEQQNLLENIKKTNTNYVTSNALNDIFKYHLKDLNDEYLKNNNPNISDEIEKEKNTEDSKNSLNMNNINNINQINHMNNIKERKSQELFQLGFYGYQNYNQLINQNQNHIIYYKNNPLLNNNNNTYNKGMNNNLNNNIYFNSYPLQIREMNEIYAKKRKSMILPPEHILNIYNNILNENNGSKEINLNSRFPEMNKKKLHIPHYIKDKHLCKQMEEKLEMNKSNKLYINNFYQEIKSSLVNIIEHQYGNYLIQKLVEILIFQENKELFKSLFLVIDSRLYEISINIYGTRFIQKTLEKLDNNYQKIETNELNQVFKNLINNHLYRLCLDKNGNHVYQKIIKIFPKDKNDFLFDKLYDIALEISLLEQGVTIFQTAFEYSNKQQKDKICNKIIDNIKYLINDQYGNYSIQKIFSLNDEKLNERIYKYISENLFELSKLKFSSNVIDKFICKSNTYSFSLIKDMIDKNIIKNIIKDQYGNYVVQKALFITEDVDNELFMQIIKQIKPVLNELNIYSIGKKIYDNLIKQYECYFNNC